MPELPEVETVARGLRKTLPGRRVLSVRLGKTDFIDDPPEIERVLPGSRIEDVRRYGKFLLLDLVPRESSPGETSLMVHLGMTGRLVTYAPQEPVSPHTHIFFELDDGRELRYTDPRRFGQVRLLDHTNRQEFLGDFGLDPLEMNLDQFRNTVHGRSARIKALLLDQHVFRGIGNIYADESLWHAKIHPAKLGNKLTESEIHALFDAIQHILNEAIRLRGSSVSDYVDSEGNRGSFQIKHRAYDREGESCFRCRAKIRRAIVAGRSSYFCPKCQRAPRAKSSRKRPVSAKSKLRMHRRK